LADERIAEEKRQQTRLILEQDRQQKALQRALYEAKQKGQPAETALAVLSPRKQFVDLKRATKPEGRS
jgi:chorismate mutase